MECQLNHFSHLLRLFKITCQETQQTCMTTEEQAVCQQQQITNELMRFIKPVKYLIVFQRDGHTLLTSKEVCIFIFYKFTFTKKCILRYLLIYFGIASKAA
jgi:hypothetical protein